MLFAFFCVDAPNSLEGRKKARPAHLERLKALEEEGRLVLAGPHPAPNAEGDGAGEGFIGSLVVADFPSLSEAEAWAAADPYFEAGVYAEVTVKPFIKALPQ